MEQLKQELQKDKELLKDLAESFRISDLDYYKLICLNRVKELNEILDK
jgi:hypothetical protein